MQKNFIYLFIIFCFLNINITYIAKSSDVNFKKADSIFFTDAEVSIINKVYDIYLKYKSFLDNDIIQTQENTNSNNNGNNNYNIGKIKLNSIMFTNKNNWTVWINGNSITNLTNSPNSEFFISYVDKNKAEIKWKMSKVKFDFINQNNNISINRYRFIDNVFELSFYLYANQTYLSHIDTIIDGDYNYQKTIKNIDDLKNKNLNINDIDISEKEINDLLNILKEEEK